MSPTARITRRGFVAGSAGAGLALGIGIGLGRCGGGADGDRGRVVVVGAGLAGLSCAYELDRMGWEVTVLEARDRVGGRCHTLREPFAGGQVAEAGGEFIDTTHSAMLELADRFGLELDDLRELGEDLDDVVYLDGERTTVEEFESDAVTAEVDRYEEHVAELAGPLDPDDPAAAGADLDERSAADLLDELELDGDARLLVESELRDEYLVEPEDLSLLFLATLAKVTEDLPDEGVEAFRIRGGNDQVPEALAEELDGVELEAPVTEVNARSDGVTVVAGGERFEADHCVVAVPLPALREVELRPEPPRALREAIDELQYGVGTKTMLQCEVRSWMEEGLSGSALTDLPIGTTWDETDTQKGAAGILMAYTSAARGVDFSDLSDDKRIAAAERDAEELFPGVEAALGASATLAWANEEFTGGAYTAYAPGQVTRFLRILREPHGRLFLAGEHTATYTSYMEGAVRSGRRVAREIERRGA